MALRSRAQYTRERNAKHPGRQAKLVARYRAKKLGLPLPELPPIARPVYHGVCASCGVEVTRFKSNGRIDRCNKCRKRELSIVEHANRRAKRAASPKVYTGTCTTCGAFVTRKKSDGRTDRCDTCRARELHARRLERNPDARRADAERLKAWTTKHPEARRLSRRVKRAIPPWTDKKAVRAFYTIARRVTRCTGVEFHVDHIIPLRGRAVSGLHVPSNLRVIPKSVNQRKSNCFGVA